MFLNIWFLKKNWNSFRGTPPVAPWMRSPAKNHPRPPWPPITPISYCKFLFYYQNKDVYKKLWARHMPWEIGLMSGQNQISNSCDIPWTNVTWTNIAWTNVTVTLGICSRWSKEPISKVFSNRVRNSWDIADIEFAVVGGGWCAKSVSCQTRLRSC